MDNPDFYSIEDEIEENVCPFCTAPTVSIHKEFFKDKSLRYRNRKFACGYHITRYNGYINKNEGPEICSNSKEHRRLHTIRFFQYLYKAINESTYGEEDLRVLTKDMLKKIESSYE